MRKLVTIGNKQFKEGKIFRIPFHLNFNQKLLRMRKDIKKGMDMNYDIPIYLPFKSWLIHKKDKELLDKILNKNKSLAEDLKKLRTRLRIEKL